MSDTQALRQGERAVDLPPPADATLRFIGAIRTPWPRREDCPRQGDPDNGPECRIVVDPAWRPALQGLEEHDRIEVYYWMHQSRRDLVAQSPRDDGQTLGTFSIRSPIRPNPIATSIVRLLRIEDGTLVVRGLDCMDGTPLVDLKPERKSFCLRAGGAQIPSEG